MDLSDAIRNHRLVDLNLFNGKLRYTGVCLAATKRIVVLINYDIKNKSFDGLTIFRNENFDTYEIWKKKYASPKEGDFTNFRDQYNIDKYKTIYAWLKKLMNKQLITFFTDNDLKSYRVGKILELDTKQAKVKLVNRKGVLIGTRIFTLRDINFFSFGSKYEKMLEKNSS